MDWKSYTIDDPIAGVKVTAYSLHMPVSNSPGRLYNIVTAQIVPYVNGSNWFAYLRWGNQSVPQGTHNSQFDQQFGSLEEAKAWCEQQIQLGHPLDRQVRPGEPIQGTAATAGLTAR